MRTIGARDILLSIFDLKSGAIIVDSMLFIIYAIKIIFQH